jgi:HSP20 family molecular chaperone IbpA
VRLPESAHVDKIHARYRRGILEVVVPLAARGATKHITVANE